MLEGQWRKDLASVIAKCKQLQDEVRTLQDSATLVAALKSARVIGCTTTGAAKYTELLQTPGVAPTVVMVEEAGELQEAHTLTSLSPKTKQLIMIGDHKQVRPKVECYMLSVESRGGHDLNVFLFERLVTSGFPHVTLGVQHRMHPGISQLVRTCTYPQLQDHPSVHEHPPVLGLEQARCVVFIDHREPELQEKGPGWGTNTFQSKVNVHEVKMTVAVVQYLLQQGYQTDQLVILMPYLGQLQELHREIKAADKSMQGALSERDMQDLRKEVQPTALVGVNAVVEASARSIRVATIDNYQGEEADVVVASLVRSNEQGSVGFLRELERINVLLSRARHGLILIGNASTLRNASNADARRHWGMVLDNLEDRGGIAKGLPASCQLHKTSTLLESPQAFRERAPQGGCCLP